MKLEDFYKMIEYLTETDAGSITGNEELQSLDGWDSLAIVEFIAKCDERLGIVLDTRKLATCKTVNDLITLLDDRVN